MYDKVCDLFYFDQIKNDEIRRIKLLLEATEIMSKYRAFNKTRILRYINKYNKIPYNDPDKRLFHQLLNLFRETPYGITRFCMSRGKSSWFWFGGRRFLVFLATPLAIESQKYGTDGIIWHSYDIFISYDWYLITTELAQRGDKYVSTVSEVRRLFPMQTSDYPLVGMPFTSRTVPFPVNSHINSEFLSTGQSLEIIHFFNQYGNL